MPLSTPNESFPLLSVLIFSPLIAAAIAACLRSETPAALVDAGLHHRGRDLLAAALAAVRPGQRRSSSSSSSPTGFPSCKINYAVGIDGISLLLVLLTTLIMPLCVLASWRYIKTRVKEFMICLLIMETAMVGVFCALDFVLFFVFWEAMLIPMALLIGIWGGPRKIYAVAQVLHLHDGGLDLPAGGHHRAAAPGRQLQHPGHDGAGTRCRPASNTGSSWRSSSRSRSRCRCSPSTPGCRPRTWKRRRPAACCWPASC